MAKSSAMPSSVAQVYAEAMMSLAKKANALQAIRLELEQLEPVFAQPELQDWLISPLVGAQERMARLEKVLRGRVSDLLCDALLVIARRDRLGMLPAIMRACRKLAMKDLHEIDVDVYSAVPMTPTDAQAVRGRLAELLPAMPIVHEHVDPSILGGLVVKIGERVIDASIRHDLDEIRESFLRRVKSLR